MKLLYAAEYRSAARGMLRGKWTEAVLVGLVASLLCGEINRRGLNLNFNLNVEDLSHTVSSVPPDSGFVEYLQQLIANGFAAGVFAVTALIGLIVLVISVVLGAVVVAGVGR